MVYSSYLFVFTDKGEWDKFDWHKPCARTVYKKMSLWYKGVTSGGKVLLITPRCTYEVLEEREPDMVLCKPYIEEVP